MANLLNEIMTGGAAGKSERATQRAVDEFGIPLPDTQDQMLNLDELVQQGVLTPEQAQVILQKDSALNNITLDPKLKQAQDDALASLQEIGQNKGLTDMDRAQLAQIESQENTAARGQREAIIQNAQSRGLGGSGIELMSQMQNQQDAATRKSSRDTSVAGTAQARALQALQQAGTLGGSMQQADFSRQAQVAQANDAISQFNTQTQNQNNAANTLARNQAAAANLAAKQKVADTNVGISNAQQEANKKLLQTDFDNKAKLAAGKANAYTGQAGAYDKEGQQTQNTYGTIISAAAAASDENLKKNKEPFDASEFLDSISPTKYDYKDSKFGKGKQVGVMAQDVEKTVPQMVEDTPEGKVLDYNKAGGPIFASLAHLNDRLDKMEGDFDASDFIDKYTGGKYNYKKKTGA